MICGIQIIGIHGGCEHSGYREQLFIPRSRINKFGTVTPLKIGVGEGKPETSYFQAE